MFALGTLFLIISSTCAAPSPRGVSFHDPHDTQQSSALRAIPHTWQTKTFVSMASAVPGCKTTGDEHLVHETIEPQSEHTVIGESPRLPTRINSLPLLSPNCLSIEANALLTNGSLLPDSFSLRISMTVWFA